MKQYGYLLVLTLLIVGLFISLSPAVSYSLFPQKRQELLSSFLSFVQKGKRLEPKTYWELREFYSPGTFITTTSSLLSPKIESSVLRPQFTVLKDLFDLQPSLYFTSQKIESIDAITPQSIDLTKLPSESHELINNKFLRISDHGSYYSLLAVTSVSAMQKANGFFEDVGNHLPPGNYSYLTLAKITK